MWTSNSKNINNLSTRVLQIEQIRDNIIEQGPIYQTPIKQSINVQGNNETPLQFDFNFFFGNSWSSGHIPVQNNEIQIPFNNNITQMNRETNLLLFKSSLEKSGYKLTPEQTVQYKDIYKKYNSINSFYDDFNCYYFPMKEIPISNNNNIINNIYPTFTKVTNVQILSDNDNDNNNNNKTNYHSKNNYNSINNLKKVSNDFENKKENINEDNIIKKDNFTEDKEDKKCINNISVIINDNEINGNKKQKVLFECLESNGSESPLSC